MKAIRPSANIEFLHDGIDDISVYKKIEKIARLCYKSEDRITDTSHVKMIENLRKRGHWAMFEHHNVVLEVNEIMWKSFMDGLWQNDEISRCLRYIHASYYEDDSRYFISGSPTAWAKLWATLKDYWQDEGRSLHSLCSWVCDAYPLLVQIPEFILNRPADSLKEPSMGELLDRDNIIGILTLDQIRELPYSIRRHHEMVTVHFVTNRGVTHEMVRHRPCAFSQESTRYCDYGGKDIVYILPSWLNTRTKIILGNKDVPMNMEAYKNMNNPDVYNEAFTCEAEKLWHISMMESEQKYHRLIKLGLQPQQARGVLPNDLKTEIYMSATLQQWEWFFKMRVPLSAHPDMREVTIELEGNQFVDLIPEFPMVETD